MHPSSKDQAFPYRAVFRIRPPHHFGLPGGDALVLPVNFGNAQIVFDRRTNQHLGRGTVSKYRSDDERIDFSFQTADGRCQYQIQDDYFTAYIFTDDQDSALATAEAVIGNILQHASLFYRVHFTYHFVQLDLLRGPEIPTDVIRSDHGDGNVIEFAQYDLEELRRSFERAIGLSDLRDPVFTTAREYAAQSVFLESLVLHPSLSDERRRNFVLASSFLYLWKAITVILGDPAVSGSGHQKRFREIGFPNDFWRQRVDPLKEVRNNWDVAHDSLDPNAAGAAAEKLRDAWSVCVDVIVKYAEFLRSGKQFSSSGKGGNIDKAQQ